jgi:catechol 2,3-dioxygenase-like lactoylglutathione lyase family enzyme
MCPAEENHMLGTMQLMAFVPTRDFRKSRAFYEGKLGLTFVGQDGFAMMMDANGTPVRVAKVPEYTPFPFTMLGWQVPDIGATVSALKKKGVACEVFGFFEQDPLGIWTAPTGDKVAWFKDPDGNLLSVSEHV